MAPPVGISYLAVVLPGLARGKCLKVGLGVMLKVVLGDLLGGKEGKRGVKIRSMSRRKSSPALEKGHIKHTGQYQALYSMSALTKGTRNLNVCVGW